MIKNKIEMNKPTYIGQKSLGLSKILIYELCKDFMMPKWDKEVYLGDISLWQVYFLDTDSLII